MTELIPLIEILFWILGLWFLAGILKKLVAIEAWNKDLHSVLLSSSSKSSKPVKISKEKKECKNTNHIWKKAGDKFVCKKCGKIF